MSYWFWVHVNWTPKVKVCIMMFCAIWYHLCNLKNVKNTHEGVLLLAKLNSRTCNFTGSNPPSWVFFTFFKLRKWSQIAQRISKWLNFPIKLTLKEFINPNTKIRSFTSPRKKMAHYILNSIHITLGLCMNLLHYLVTWKKYVRVN